jgi:hypothetical protein
MKVLKTVSVIALIFIGALLILPKMFFGNVSGEELGWSTVGLLLSIVFGAAILSGILFVPFLFKEINNKNIPVREQKKNKIIIGFVVLIIISILSLYF